MKSVLTLQQEGMARMIARAGVTATLPDGTEVRGLMKADGETARLAQFQGAVNVRTPEYYTFYTLTEIEEGLNVLVIADERWNVTHVHPMHADGGIAWYEVNLLGRGQAA